MSNEWWRGAVIYQHEVDTSRVLVAEHVAAEMTDLLQTAVNTGTGKAAQIGRPVAGKTGTTTSSKDGWFLGFSSGLTTGVWVGRDDARAIPGLHGGTIPARIFSSFMTRAVANRPVEQFDTQVTMPEWAIDNEEDYFGGPDNGVFVDPDGMPVNPDDGARDGEGQQGQQGDSLDEDWIDRMTGKAPRDQQQPPPIPAPRDVPRPSANPERQGPREPGRTPSRDPNRGDSDGQQE